MPHYLHYDVFTNRPFEGNQLAVFPDARGLPAERMQVITREMNFSESTFVLPAEANGTAVRMRIFTPGSELPMAGHPTIGTTFALADLGVIRPGADHFVFGLGLGPTRVELEWQGSQLHFAWMDQRPPEFRQPASSPDEILRAIGLPDAARPGGGPPIEEVSCGVPFLLVPLASSGEVDRAEADAGALRRLRSAFPQGHVGVFLFALEPDGSDVTVYSRMFAPGSGVPEDPATGSATGPLGCYLVAHEVVPATRWLDMVSLQGVRLLRPSRLHMRIQASAADAITRVQVGGQAVRVGAGSVDV
ncbi:MAG: PhzF family phenazine biosynthesis protein [Acidobacteria bacterium]|nr:PhzF family phenazine biosynthesis protein [Acidobacteriota bacterium]